MREDVAERKSDALRGIGIGDAVAQILIEATQHLVAAVDDGGVDAQLRKDAGELHGDIAAAGDDDALGQARQIESLVGGDDVLDAGPRLGKPGLAAGSNQNLLRRDRAA